MNENNILQYINQLESNLGYSLEPSYATLTSVLPSESYSMHVDQENANYIEININNNDPNNEINFNNNDPNNIQPSSSSSSNPQIQSKTIKKRQRYSVEFKQKILHMLKTHTQTEVQALVNIDRRIIGTWAKEANKNKIENCVEARTTFKIYGTDKDWWPELEANPYQWYIV